MATKTDVRLIYTGRYSDCGVEVNLPDGSRAFVPGGGELVTTAEHAASLLQQDGEWTRAAAKSTPKEAVNDG